MEKKRILLIDDSEIALTMEKAVLENRGYEVRATSTLTEFETTLKGWRSSTEGVTEFDKLPKAAQEYLRFQEKESGAKIGMVSTGPDREQTMVLPEFAAALKEIHA